MTDRIRSRSQFLAAGVTLLVLMSACNREDGAERTALPGDSTMATALPPGHPSAAPAAELSEVARTMLDSGNVEFRAKRFDAARQYYEQAAALAPLHAAPWFGLYMIGDATRNKQLADSAMGEVRKRTGEPVTPAGADSALRNPHATLPGT